MRSCAAGITQKRLRKGGLKCTELKDKPGNYRENCPGNHLKARFRKGAAKAAKGIIYQNGSSAALSFSGSGSLTLSDTAGADGIRSKGTVTITDGSFDIDVYGDGIQAETIDISGGDLDIATYFENAGLNYYNTALANTDLGTYNTMSTVETSSSKTKTERINIDTGSHKGIKAGSKAESYSYKSVEDGSEYTAGTEYSSSASGGLTISGGTIKVDTTATGIKYNNGSGGMQSGSSGSGNLTAADDGKVIIGAPEDGIKRPVPLNCLCNQIHS